MYVIDPNVMNDFSVSDYMLYIVFLSDCHSSK